MKYHHTIRALLGERLIGSAEQLAVQADLTGSDGVKPGYGIQKRGLAASRRPHDHAHFTRLNLEGAVVDGEHVDALRIVDLGHVANAYRALPGSRRVMRFHQRPSSASARTRHCISRLPTMRTMADVAQPTKPNVIMPITIGMVTLFM